MDFSKNQSKDIKIQYNDFNIQKEYIYDDKCKKKYEFDNKKKKYEVLKDTNQTIDLKMIKTINVQNNSINSLSIFPSGNVVLISEKSIKLFDLNFNILQHIQNAHDEIITYIDIKDENNFVTCSYNKEIKIWIKNENKFILNKNLINAHYNYINQVKYYLNNNIISCSLDKTVKIWEEINNKFQLIITLFHSFSVFSILILEDKNKLISSGLNGTKIWNLNNFEVINFFKEVGCYYNNGLCRINEDKIIFVEDKSLKIFSLSEEKIIKHILIPFRCITICKNEEKGIFFIEDYNKNIKIYNNDSYECIKTIKSTNNFYFNGFTKLKNSLFVSFSNDGSINIWLFK